MDMYFPGITAIPDSMTEQQFTWKYLPGGWQIDGGHTSVGSSKAYRNWSRKAFAVFFHLLKAWDERLLYCKS